MPIPAAHASEVELGMYPSAQATVQVPPSAIEVTPKPQAPVGAALATLVGTAHASSLEWQVGSTKKPRPNSPCSHRAVAWVGVNPVAQATVQDSPLAIEVTPLPQMSVAALVTGGMADTRHGSGSQVKAAMVPSVHKAL
jgi:hypothetical protein